MSDIWNMRWTGSDWTGEQIGRRDDVSRLTDLLIERDRSR